MGLLSEHRRVLAVDLPGHGGSAEISTDLEGIADAVLDLAGSERFDLLGYSLGGRAALTLALRRPDRLRSLVLIGATAGIADEAERLARRRADEALADEIEEEGDVASFLDRWLAQDLFSDLDAEQAQLAERLVNSPAGLASSLRSAGTGTQVPSWDRLGEIDRPALVIAGALDERYCAIGAEMAAGMPQARFELVPGARHACHLSAPREAAEIVEAFLAGLDHPT